MAELRLGARGPIPEPIMARVARQVVISDTGCHIWQGVIDRWDGRPRMIVGSTVDNAAKARAGRARKAAERRAA